jgi:DNA adenine methylase
LLRKPRSYAEVYNDLDGEVVNFFRVLRDHGGELERLVRLTAFARDEFELSYEPSSNPIEQARRTITRSFMGFGSGGTTGKKTGFRCNSNRSGTTPAHDWANLPQNISRLADRLTGVVIENRPATDVIAQQDSPQALHYVDPPYVAATRDKGADYRHEMSDGEHESLAEFLRGLKGMVIVSGYPSPLYDRLFSGWRTADLAALADGASKRTERLWMNFDAPRRLF